MFQESVISKIATVIVPKLRNYCRMRDAIARKNECRVIDCAPVKLKRFTYLHEDFALPPAYDENNHIDTGAVTD